jgi:hypothetical protein
VSYLPVWVSLLYILYYPDFILRLWWIHEKPPIDIDARCHLKPKKPGFYRVCQQVKNIIAKNPVSADT